MEKYKNCNESQSDEVNGVGSIPVWSGGMDFEEMSFLWFSLDKIVCFIGCMVSGMYATVARNNRLQLAATTNYFRRQSYKKHQRHRETFEQIKITRVILINSHSLTHCCA